MNDDGRNDTNDDAADGAPDDSDAPRDMSDERFDAWLRSSVRDYNRPGEQVPRDLMWSEIERGLPAVVIPIRRPRRTAVWWQAAAALLLVAGGIAIGRQWQSRSVATPPVAQQGPERLAPSSAGDAPPSRPIPQAPQLASAEPATATSSPNAPAAGGSSPAARGTTSESNGSYDMATMEHLSRAEALLTSFRTPRSAGDGAPLNRWARDLLADTRLLLDSPAATDARRRQLLEDLELILAQIVQLPAEASADRGLVQRSIERGAVLSRLRSSIPAGYTSGT